MARPSRNNAEYFYHSANYRNDRRVKAIRAQFGIAGYGLLLMLMEALTDAEHTQLCVDEMELELLAGDFGVSATEIDSLLQKCVKVGIFCISGDRNLTCPELSDSLKAVFEKRNRAKETFEKRRQGVSVTETGVSVADMPRIEGNRREEKGIEERGDKDNLDLEQESSPSSSVVRENAPAAAPGDGVVAAGTAGKGAPVASTPGRLPTTPGMTPPPANRGAGSGKSPGGDKPPQPPPERGPTETFGDNELRQKCLDYATANPGLYPAEMYKAFLRHWTAPLQNGTKSQLGKELWRTEKTFNLAGRLSTWKQLDDKHAHPRPGAHANAGAAFRQAQRDREPATDYGTI